MIRLLNLFRKWYTEGLTGELEIQTPPYPEYLRRLRATHRVQGRRRK